MGQHARIHRVRLDVQTLGITPARARAIPVACGAIGQGRSFRRQYRFGTLQTHLTRLFAIATPVHLVHARINGCDHLGGAVFAVRTLSQDRQVGNRQYRALQRKGQALHHANGDTHAGKGTRPATEGNGLDRRQLDTRRRQQVLDHR